MCAHWDETQVGQVVGASRNASDAVVVFWEEMSGKASQKTMQRIESSAHKTHEFKVLSGENLRKWIRDEAGRILFRQLEIAGR